MGDLVPATGRITGVVVGLEKETTPAAVGALVDQSVRLLRGQERLRSEERSGASPWPAQSTLVTYGGPDDSWGHPWQPDDVAAGKLNLSIVVAHTAATGLHSAIVRRVRYKVHYRCD